MSLVFTSTESPSINLARHTGPRIGFLLRSTDRLGWRLSWSASHIESGTGDVALAPKDIIISDFQQKEWGELRNRHSIRLDDFFRLTMRGIQEEWGLQDEGPAEALRHLDPILRRVMTIFEHVAADLGVEEVARLYDGWKAAAFFTETVVKASGHIGVRQEDHKNLSMSLSGAYAAGVWPQTAAKAPPREVFSFRRPGLTVLRDILGSRTPAGDWRAIGQELTSDVVQQILALKLPTLFQIAWRPTPRAGVDPALMRATLRYLGWESPRDQPRDWATLEEMMMLNKVVDVSAFYAFVATDWSTPSFGPPMLDSLRHFRPSWCVDLVAHNLLAAMTTRNKQPVSPSPLAVWTTTRDRISITPVLLAFANAGFPVISAYLGGLRVHCPPARREEAIKLAWSLGLTPPLSLSMTRANKNAEDAVERVEGDEIDGVRWGGEADLLDYAALRANGDFDELLALDGIIDPENESELE